MSQPRGFWRGRWLIPIASSLVLYGCFYLLQSVLFNVAIVPVRVPADLALFTALSLLLFALARRVWPFLILQALLAAMLYPGSAAKIAIMGRPLMPEDIYSLEAFIRLMGPLGWVLAGIPLFLMALLFIGNLPLGRRLALSAVIVLPVGSGIAGGGIAGGSLAAPTLLAWMDDIWGDKPWDQRENYVWRGGTIHMAQELLRVAAIAQPTPARDDVAAVLVRHAPAPRPGGLPVATPRNVHLVLEESFWDPAPLTATGLAQSPLDPRFLKLWDAAGRSTALSPAFGGQTANAEFEVLCGFPLAQGAVRFEQPLNDDLPCLPRLLAGYGYRSIASHPNTPGFWNRAASYDRLGFETFWSSGDFVADDMTSIFLADASLHRQVGEKIAASADPRPVFDYTVTYYGHWLYDLDARRPQAFATKTAVEELHRYVSVMHWKSRDMMDAIEHWQRTDPDALIVVFGDHLPLLGQNLAGYAESGFLGNGGDSEDAAMQMRSAETPLLVIDGRNGPVKLGRVPMYRLPHLVLDLLGIPDAGIHALATPPDDLILRPLPGKVVGMDAAGRDFLCQGGTPIPPCDRVAAWQADIDLLARDIFSGDGHAPILLDRPQRHPPGVPISALRQ
ncbi:phosphoglycerol transferase MdoB-like AlkP superfamily enzyme [Dongia mobilis]|uniref:Phosphoglycerol transferase MdoB-like AlkP superfamily enzyme n=1 Tax=Dongia mobilis TaxID=578943 RepID=A0A4R6WRM3_9PROT|nr:LTA synthase family protein [Dongia mobilis]TDQ82187.1 phosphoglycerol transferase MdoB-like AlkP superfamily enzyme [Dongia mobilis]